MIDWHPEWLENGDNHFRFCGHWEWSNDDPTCRPYVRLEMWRTLRETPKGRWIVNSYANQWQIEHGAARQRFVLNTGRKRWAYPTKMQAWNSFLIRQRHRLNHARNNLEGVETLTLFIEAHKP